MNESPYDGQWRQVAWLLVARGARLIEYWHWHTLPSGTETYWGGVLPHSGIPGRAYHEIARIGQELREAGGAFATTEPDYDIAVLYDSDSKFALSTQGPLRGDSFISATGFAEGLVASGAEVLASYQHPHLGRWAAVTTKAAGAGRITVVGTVPDQTLAADLVRWLIPHAVGRWTTDDSVTVSTSTDMSAATRLHVLHNWSWDEAAASPSCPVTDVLGGKRHPAGEKIALQAWDVRLFLSHEAPDQDQARRREA